MRDIPDVWMTKDLNLKADKKYWGRAGIPTFYGYPGFEGASNAGNGRIR